jgi:L-ascorbate metabolism protein UlaG (beta-lactamase superfamily)
MNSSNVCHEIDGCLGLYVDAFRGHYLKKTQDADSAFILTHYHGDHYGSLPRKGKYHGPAIIHCTPVTAELLISVHQVPVMYVVEHNYGESFFFRMKGPHPPGKKPPSAKITFYDANHCPGACIVLIQLPDGTTHLHTGDMRYHEKMKTYPLLQEAVLNRKVDLVYLDTTYGHPKHDFVPQHEAIESIASQTEELLGTCSSAQGTSNTLVLLSCYSIGKEKVLWEASTRVNQLVYVSDRKLRMLDCIQGHDPEVSSQIITRCTQDASKSDIHVIPMGLAGEIWPYFRPNYQKCADYARKLDKRYDRVAAFLPTGWANSSNWNKKNATSKKQVDYETSDGEKRSIDVEVRLISYSEHSAFSELVSFVEYLRPRKVIPTVFSDEADCRKIEGRFRNLLDSTRAKQAFFRTMEQSVPLKTDITTNESSQAMKQPPEQNDSKVLAKASETEKRECKDVLHLDDTAEDLSDVEIVHVQKPTPPEGDSQKRKRVCGDSINTLTSMGFDRRRAETTLQACNGDVDAAIGRLLSWNEPELPYSETQGAATSHALATPSSTDVGGKPPNNSSPSLITSFFSLKKT